MLDLTSVYCVSLEDADIFEINTVKVFDCDVVGNPKHPDYQNFDKILAEPNTAWNYASLIAFGRTEKLVDVCVIAGKLKEKP